MNLAIPGRFFVRLLAPTARHHNVGGFATREVKRHDGVFTNAAALHEQNFEVAWNRQEFTHIGFGLLVNRDEFFAAVAHLHHAHAAAVPVGHLGRCLLQHF